MDYNQVENKMQERIDYLESELGNIRAGRANPQILNKVQVEYYGAMTPLNQVAAISVPEARQIMIAPWDKSLITPIMKAIQVAELGINPMNDGNGIRLTFPELNEERRREIVKSVKSLGEDTKVGIRNARRDAIDEAKKAQSYINTKFFHAMVSLLKISQNAAKGVYELVPLQDFSENWSDEKLYEKYGFRRISQRPFATGHFACDVLYLKDL
jgi:ribosome recycling factor